MITDGKLFPLKVQGCGVSITTGGLLFIGIFGAVRVLSVWGFTIYDMGEKFPIGRTEGRRVCAGGVFSAGGFFV